MARTEALIMSRRQQILDALCGITLLTLFLILWIVTP